ncbi:Asp23/Gls24 family envelope stress response protein [Pseudalkalibacillus caeni]|uniref:Asp23/Gls24 family envelope stress response protein n=1 Tax=Exobacillus caeni TaxID=2574798 RepID=A0A5R9FCE2_9BACL|nr:Asp23/Gls24 family envelope stress response protein [Pseudalkalibacillus caeni]TLS37325.1 Asp23/Gls24 family envelope stress response protein [Pseudalkalibacillus caeni]
MSIELKTQYGQIDISTEVIAAIAGGAAIDCYGIVGMASQKQLKDGITELLGKDNFSRGIVVRKETEEEEVHIDMYIIVSYGTKISEVAHNVQTKVKYQLDQMIGLAVDSVNIYVQGVRVTNP